MSQLTLEMDTRTDAQKRFDAFHADNPDVYELFKRFTFEKIDAGKKKYSARGIIFRIRWETDIQTTEEQPNINDHWSPFYARMFMRDFPRHEGFFELRKQQGEQENT